MSVAFRRRGLRNLGQLVNRVIRVIRRDVRQLVGLRRAVPGVVHTVARAIQSGRAALVQHAEQARKIVVAVIRGQIVRASHLRTA